MKHNATSMLTLKGVKSICATHCSRFKSVYKRHAAMLPHLESSRYIKVKLKVKYLWI